MRGKMRGKREIFGRENSMDAELWDLLDWRIVRSLKEGIL